MDMLVVEQTRPEHAERLEALQRICFPTLDDAQRFKAAHYLHHIALFPEGQLVALDGDTVAAVTTTLRHRFDRDHPDHTFAEIIQGGWLTSHDPHGDWLYGADLSVHPHYRRRGLGAALYAARHALVRRLGLKGQVTGGMIRDYGAVKDRMSVEEYVRAVIERRISDSTLSMQLAIGFEARAVLPNYVEDPACDNYGVLLVLEADRRVRVTEPFTTKTRSTR
jgi:GNAT superfamily N-acetyltransferase